MWMDMAAVMFHAGCCGFLIARGLETKSALPFLVAACIGFMALTSAAAILRQL